MASASGGLLDALWGKSNARWLSSDVHHPRRATVCLGTRIIHYTDHWCTLLLLRYYYYKVALWPIIIRNKRTRTKHVVQQWFSTLHIFFFSFPVGLVFCRARRFTKSCSSQRLHIACVYARAFRDMRPGSTLGAISSFSMLSLPYQSIKHIQNHTLWTDRLCYP